MHSVYNVYKVFSKNKCTELCDISFQFVEKAEYTDSLHYWLEKTWQKSPDKIPSV
jgi:hypothetical protein